MTTEDARRIEKALTGGTAEQVGAAVALPADATISPESIAQLASLNLQIDEGTFTVIDDQTAEVSATVDGRAWTVYLLRVEESWKVAEAVVAP